MHPSDKLFIEGESNSGLRERREAIARATYEFYRVKRAKLEKESEHGARAGNSKEKKQLYRERANRASAAASRAKIVCYAKELEKRTDKLEQERNLQLKKAERAIQKLHSMKEKTTKLKNILRYLWEKRDPNTCSFLIESNALALLAPNTDDENLEEIEAHDISKCNSIRQNNSVVLNVARNYNAMSHERKEQSVSHANNISPSVSLEKRANWNESMERTSNLETKHPIFHNANESTYSHENSQTSGTKDTSYKIPPIRGLDNTSQKRGYSVSQLLDPMPEPIRPSPTYLRTNLQGNTTDSGSVAYHRGVN